MGAFPCTLSSFFCSYSIYLSFQNFLRLFCFAFTCLYDRKIKSAFIIIVRHILSNFLPFTIILYMTMCNNTATKSLFCNDFFIKQMIFYICRKFVKSYFRYRSRGNISFLYLFRGITALFNLYLFVIGFKKVFKKFFKYLLTISKPHAIIYLKNSLNRCLYERVKHFQSTFR